jgi:hypothetical protein
MREDMGPGRGSSRRRGLTCGSRSADNGAMDSSRAPGSAREDARQSRERGQALVEFALIVPLFLLIVVGMIQFGIALNYWLDLNRIANQGARWAVVNKYPDCPDEPGCTLKRHLEKQVLSAGNTPIIDICFVDSATGAVGEPVRVRAIHKFRFAAIVNQWSIDLKGEATMRIEQEPTKLREPAQGIGLCPT